jgi:hypothetical protein
MATTKVQGHTCAIEEVTPERAKEMLHSGNRKNRALNEAAVRRIMGIIARGEWMSDSTDAIGLATDGGVVNGQHRLEAISRGDTTVSGLVLRNVSPDVVKIIDQGMSRNLAQTLAMDGGYVEPGTTATAVEWMYSMINRREKTMPNEFRPTVPQLLDILQAHPNVVESLDPAGEVKFKIKGMTKGIFTAYHYAMACADSELADEFYLQLATGLEVTEDSPAYVLREKYNSDTLLPEAKRMKKWEGCAFLVIAWEATRRGEVITKKHLRVTRSGSRAQQVPTVSDVSWLAELED